MAHARDWSEPAYNPVAGWDPYPSTEEGWKNLYDLRWSMYLLHPYSAGVQKQEHLFRAFDDSGNEIDQTRRIFRFYQFIADTDARALHGGRLTLETFDTKPGQAKAPMLLAGEAVWKRSRIAAAFPKWARMLCPLGDYWLEAVRMSPIPPYRTQIVGYDPRNVEATYDAETGTQLVELRIRLDHQDADEARDNSGAPTVNRYERVLTRETVEIIVNGVSQGAKPHGLGAVPAVHLQCLPWDQPEHSLPAPAGVERALMHLDSFQTQTKAVGTRYAQPTLMTTGFKLGRNSDVALFGRTIDGVPKGGTAEYLESKLSSLPPLLEAMRDLTNHVRETSPEFMFATDAARESAESRSMRGQAFEAKMTDMRAGVFAALAEVTAMAVAMDQALPFDLDTVPYQIDAPPVLPRNVKVEVEVLDLCKGDMLRADRIRALQRLGIVGNQHDPEGYAAEVMDETSARASAFFTDGPDTTQAGDGAGGNGTTDTGKIADTAFTGVQTERLDALLAAVADGSRSPEVVKLVLLEAFPSIPPERVDAMLAAARKFTPPVVTPAAG